MFSQTEREDSTGPSWLDRHPVSDGWWDTSQSNPRGKILIMTFSFYVKNDLCLCGNFRNLFVEYIPQCASKLYFLLGPNFKDIFIEHRKLHEICIVPYWISLIKHNYKSYQEIWLTFPRLWFPSSEWSISESHSPTHRLNCPKLWRPLPSEDAR